MDNLFVLKGAIFLQIGTSVGVGRMRRHVRGRRKRHSACFWSSHPRFLSVQSAPFRFQSPMRHLRCVEQRPTVRSWHEGRTVPTGTKGFARRPPVTTGTHTGTSTETIAEHNTIQLYFKLLSFQSSGVHMTIQTEHWWCCMTVMKNLPKVPTQQLAHFIICSRLFSLAWVPLSSYLDGVLCKFHR